MVETTTGFGIRRLSDTLAPPSAYTPEHLAQRIWQNRDAVQGERKFVTVLFADIGGSTALIDALDAEDAIAKLDPALAKMIAAVHRYEGTVCRVQGDGIMALFGAPLADEDHALRACYAALAMQRAIAEADDPDIAIRVGLHSGPVVVRSIENDLSINYDASGSAVHLAARMEQLAQIGKIRLTADTYRLVEGFVDVEPLGPVEVRGRADPIEVYALAQRQRGRSRWQVRAARGLTRLVGREAELQALRAALDRAEARQPGLFTIEADPGVGKSRLVHELLAALAGRELTVVECSGAPESLAVPYYPVESMMRTWLAVDDQDAPLVVARTLAETVDRLDESLRIHLPAYQDILHLEVDDAGWRELEPAERRARMRQAVLDLVIYASELRPVVLVLEDLHWVDGETLAILDLMVDRLGASRVLVVASCRPEFDNPWRDHPLHAGIRLEPLDRRAARELVDALLGEDAALDDLKTRVIERAGGTPLFIEEIVGDLKHSGALVSENGRFVLTKAVSEIELPVTVQAVIASRIDRLTPEARSLLQTASVIGEAVPAELLRITADLDENTLLARMGTLKLHEFILESQMSPELLYAFKHALVRDVAYESVLKANRRALHAAVVAAIEKRYHNQVDRYADRLAQHAKSAEMWQAAVDYARKAAFRALDRSAYGQAVRHLEGALQALDHLPQDDERRKLEIDLRLALRAPLGATGAVDKMVQRLAEAEALAKDLGDEWRLGATKISQAFAFNSSGDLDSAEEAGEAGLAIAERIDDDQMRLAGSYHLAQSYMWSGKFDRVRELLLPGEARVARTFRTERPGTAGTISVLWFGMLGAAEAYMGDFEDSARHVDAAVKIADELRRPYDQAIARWYKGFSISYGGAHDVALEWLQDAYRRSKQAQIEFLIPVVATSLGNVYASLGRTDEAVTVLEDAIDRYTSAKFSYGVAYATLNLAFARMQKGETERFGRLLRKATDLAVRHGFAGIEVPARRFEALALGRAKDNALKAEAVAQRSLALATARGMRPDVGHCHLVLARLRSRSGDVAAAREHAATAIRLYRELGMTAWLERAEKLAGGASSD